MSERCEVTDLVVDQCGGPCHRPDLVDVGELPARVPGSTTIEARFPGRCGHCERPIRFGELISRADVDGVGLWCLHEHTRELGSVSS